MSYESLKNVQWKSNPDRFLPAQVQQVSAMSTHGRQPEHSTVFIAAKHKYP